MISISVKIVSIQWSTQDITLPNQDCLLVWISSTELTWSLNQNYLLEWINYYMIWIKKYALIWQAKILFPSTHKSQASFPSAN